MRNYKGIAYPIAKTTHGLFHNGTDIDQIKANFLTIIMTKPGERVMEPFFGTPLHMLDFTKPLELVEEDCRQMIAKTLKIWEKRFPVTALEVKILSGDINITVNFIDPLNLQEEHVLTLQMPIGE